MSAALVFICSDHVGPYVNAVSYLRDKRGVASFTFIFITGALVEGPRTDFVESITAAFESLGEGRYLGRPAHVDEKSQARYRETAEFLDCRSSVKVVPLEDLAGYISREAKSVKLGQLAIDVTGLPKVLAAHVMLICLAVGRQVHTFELRQRTNPKAPELSLYHALSAGDFDYPSLARDPAVLASVRQLVHVKRATWAIVVVSLIGMASLAVLIAVDAKNPALAIVGLAANVIGIAGGTLQAITIYKGK
ncbi:hypothetical protein GA0070618_1897 [Micromonospora echinospora]|uniref:Uncharacterized protein n=1 Tax=Micromonospora echinospora TaxID=1877 RepID=A0A1C4W6D8_MICEC|nr:hypothetical protein [Micromonospora echinospora]SCE91770.1 hypothetical protein GA0070618_1897 [Micromonospora echinospora]